MLIVSFIGQKGGVGKSALARVLAVAAAKQSKTVLIADFDLEQLSCVEWSAARLRLGQFPEVEARAFKSMKKLRKTVEGYDLVVVDTRGLADELTDDVSKESDLVFLPTGTSRDDLRPTLALARKISKKADPNKIILILSKIGRSERQILDAKAQIEDAGFILLEATWPQRDGFQSEFDLGRAGSEASNHHLRQCAENIENAMLSRLFGG